MKKQIDLTQKIMVQIEKEHITLRPAWYFWLQKYLLIVVSIFVLALSLFFVNLVMFKFRFYDPFGYLVFGMAGFRAFWGSIPWQILGYLALVVAALTLFIQKIDIFYRYPKIRVYFSMAVILITLAKGLDMTSLNEQARKANIAPSLYHGIFNTEYWIMGQVVSINPAARKLTVLTQNNEIIDVDFINSTIYPGGIILQKGDTLQLIGHREDHGVFTSTGIHKE